MTCNHPTCPDCLLEESCAWVTWIFGGNGMCQNVSDVTGEPYHYLESGAADVILCPGHTTHPPLFQTAVRNAQAGDYTLLLVLVVTFAIVIFLGFLAFIIAYFYYWRRRGNANRPARGVAWQPVEVADLIDPNPGVELERLAANQEEDNVHFDRFIQENPVQRPAPPNNRLVQRSRSGRMIRAPRRLIHEM